MDRIRVHSRVGNLLKKLDTQEKQYDAMFEALKSLVVDTPIAPVTRWDDGDDPLITIQVPASVRSKAYDILLAINKIKRNG